MTSHEPISTTQAGVVIHNARRYDLHVWWLTRGREAAFRAEQLDLAGVGEGEDVLDVGSGTGTLAIAAARRVGAGGSVAGIDPSPERVARATGKARRAKVGATFREGIAQAIPWPDASFDAVLCTLVLHQLPADGLHGAFAEFRRVLRPRGRLLVVTSAGRSRAATPCTSRRRASVASTCSIFRRSVRAWRTSGSSRPPRATSVASRGLETSGTWSPHRPGRGRRAGILGAWPPTSPLPR